jgi:hypothetical protein
VTGIVVSGVFSSSKCTLRYMIFHITYSLTEFLAGVGDCERSKIGATEMVERLTEF